MSIKNILEVLLANSDENIKKAYLDNQKYLYNLGNSISKKIFENTTESQQREILKKIEEYSSNKEQKKEEDKEKI